MATTTRTPQRRPNLTVIMGGRSTPSGKLTQQNSLKPATKPCARKIICKLLGHRSAEEIFNPTRQISDPFLAVMIAWLGEAFRNNDDDAAFAYTALQQSCPSFEKFVQDFINELRPHYPDFAEKR